MQPVSALLIIALTTVTVTRPAAAAGSVTCKQQAATLEEHERCARREQTRAVVLRSIVPAVATAAYVIPAYLYADRPAGRVLAIGGGTMAGACGGLILGAAIGMGGSNGDTGLGGVGGVLGSAAGLLVGSVVGGVITTRQTRESIPARYVASGLGAGLFVGTTIWIQIRREF